MQENLCTMAPRFEAEGAKTAAAAPHVTLDALFRDERRAAPAETSGARAASPDSAADIRVLSLSERVGASFKDFAAALHRGTFAASMYGVLATAAEIGMLIGLGTGGMLLAGAASLVSPGAGGAIGTFVEHGIRFAAAAVPWTIFGTGASLVASIALRRFGNER